MPAIVPAYPIPAACSPDRMWNPDVGPTSVGGGLQPANPALPTTARLTALLLACAALALPADVDAGKRLYLEGVLHSNSPLEATVSGDVTVNGADWRCERCHRRSGLGGVEGGLNVPPISGNALFQPAELVRADRAMQLFEEAHSLTFRAQARSARGRPAYDVRSLGVALRQGIDPAGHPLYPAMPRYRIGDDDLDNLAAYLATLNVQPAPGVTPRTLRFATVIAPDAPPADRASWLYVAEAWIAQQNREAGYQAARIRGGAWDREDAYAASRRWILDTWELRGAPATWTAQLEDFYERQPVFALLGGVVPGPWQPVGDFCDRFRIPCLFPETVWLPDSGPENYSVHWAKGLLGEAQALASVLRGAQRVLQFHSTSPFATAAAQAFEAALPEVVTVPLPAASASAIAEHRPGAVVVWADNDDVRNLHCAGGAALYLSATLTTAPVPCTKAYLVSSVGLGDNPSREREHMRSWRLSRAIPAGNERIQADAQFLFSLLDDALRRMSGRFSRDFLVETIEREIESARNPGVYPRLSLAPGQRFASKGAWILAPEGGSPRWIIP